MSRRRDVGGYLYERLRTLYPVSRVPTYHEIKDAAEARGYQVHETPGLPGRGLCVEDASGIHICLRRAPDVPGASHELKHAWLLDNIRYGIEYLPPEWEAEDAETAALRFERLVVEGE